MRTSNKSRNRNKNNRRAGAGNNINRVFESSGPEGRVRGTPQQIIDKYISLTHDAQLAGDRVSAENFQQHAEHYARLLNEAQKELAEKQVDNNSGGSVTKLAQRNIADDEGSLIADTKDTTNSKDEKVVEFDNQADGVASNDSEVTEFGQIPKVKTQRTVAKKKQLPQNKSLEI